MVDNKHQSEDWLREKYIDEGLLQREIADECNVDQATISYWLDRFEISKETPKHQKPEWLQSKLEDGLSQHDIADLTDITYEGVRYQIRKHNLGIYDCEVSGCEERYPTEEGLLQHLSREHPDHEEDSYGLRTDKVTSSQLNKLEEMIEKEESQFNPEIRDENLKKAHEVWDAEEHSELLIEMWEEKDPEDYPVNQDGFWEKYLETRDSWGPNWEEVEETGHVVASSWEAEVDVLLHDSGMEYEYEGETFTIEDTWNTPDFIGESWILEVKSPAGYRDKERLDMVGKYLRDEVEREYIILGEDVDMPCNIFVEWEDREEIIDIISNI